MTVITRFTRRNNLEDDILFTRLFRQGTMLQVATSSGYSPIYLFIYLSNQSLSELKRVSGEYSVAGA
jgi:hypothetical protein